MDLGPCDAFVQLTPSGLLERIAPRSIQATVLEKKRTRTHPRPTAVRRPAPHCAAGKRVKRFVAASSFRAIDADRITSAVHASMKRLVKLPKRSRHPPRLW